jgi:hypothetical protein
VNEVTVVVERSDQFSVRDLMSYQDIADDLGVKVTSVYQYALRDDDFPIPVIEGRSPYFARIDYERWRKIREVRGANRPGRPRSKKS